MIENGYGKILERALIEQLREDMEAYFNCQVFPDTHCFGCGLCDMARQEKKYFEEWLEEQEFTTIKFVNGDLKVEKIK
jgi:hypothetical protein